MPKVILASKSTVRKKMLEQLNIPFEVIVSNADETPTECLSFKNQLKEISLKKAQIVLRETNSEGERIIVSADQNIVFHNKMYGKPKTIEEARMLIKDMRGSDQIFAYTGNTVIYANGSKVLSFINECDVARMRMDPVEDEIIENYLTNGFPLERCGGINIDETNFLHLEEGKISTARGMTTEHLQKILSIF